MSRRLLQVALLILSLSPLGFGTIGMVRGAEWLGHDVAPDLDSHFRYLSGIFFGVGLALLACIPRIESATIRFRWIAALVIIGGLARLGGVLAGTVPGTPHLVGLGVEVVLTPLLVLWQSRLRADARR